jgi:hypothetical protein
MIPKRFLLLAATLWLTAGCVNSLYQGELAAADAYGKNRHFLLYWTKTDPLIGQSKAGPAILLTECSPLTRVEFGDRPDGIVFRGMPGFDLLPGQIGVVNPDPICGKVLNYTTLGDARAGPLAVAIYCRPAPGDGFAVQPRDYLAARPEPYVFPIDEKIRNWSLWGETLPGPPVPECREPRTPNQ